MKNYDLDKTLEGIKSLSAYTIKAEGHIPELDSYYVEAYHNKTRARLFLILNADDNKVFNIGFRTPCEDSTGVAHIIEHTVLCGSKKFPAKDPFVELVKGSLNTFLNAMTYMDKTIYPVASTNDKDFKNLMEVYLDAVLYPNIYKEDKIFKQEGWHYELEDKDSKLTINGIVYNEMKGAFSSADGVMERAISRSLFEGYSYGEESGGDPDFIPELTYEAFLNFHRKYYHPSNSFIYLYGDMDMKERLEYMDREYLSAFDYKKVDSALEEIVPWTEKKTAIYEYSISDTESEENASYLSLHTVVGGELEPVKFAAFQVLSYILLEMPGAYLREALIEAGIGEDITGGYDYGIKEPYFSIIAKGTNVDKKEEFEEIVRSTLQKLVDEGIDKESILATINVNEFRVKEADFGRYPKGLMYGLEAYHSWLYDADPTMHLRYEKIFAELKECAKTDYFETLIEECLLKNPYTVSLILKPVKGLTARKEQALAEKLAQIKAKMSMEEIEQVIRETKELKAYQKEASSKEDLEKIPMLKREDIKKQAGKVIWAKEELDGVDLIYSEVFTSGIAYLKFVFDISMLEREELPYLGLLREVLAYIDTEKHSYLRLANLLNLHTGGLGFHVESYADDEDITKAAHKISLNTKVLYEKLDFVLDIILEILLHSNLFDTKRLKDILLEVKSAQKQGLLAAGNITALTRALSGFSKASELKEYTSGIEYYRCLEELASGDDMDALAQTLHEIASKIFDKKNLLIHITAEKKGYERCKELLPAFLKALPNTSDIGPQRDFEEQLRDEAFMSSSQVNYIARVGNFKKHGFAYTGLLQVLKVLLSYGYLWNNIRVLGGAYGAAAVFSRNGNAGFVSYRDPNLAKTDVIYDGVADFVRNFKADEREMTKLIIGAISEMDTPLTPAGIGLKGFSSYMHGISDEDYQRERDEILGASAEDINALAPMMEAILSYGVKVAVGSSTKIEEEKEHFKKVENLYKE